MVMLVFRCISEYELGMFENCLETSSRILRRNADDNLGTIAGYRTNALARLQGEVDPELDWLAVAGLEIEKFASTAKLSGDAADLNAAAWPVEAVPGTADKLDGAWQARMSLSSAPGMGLTLSAKIMTSEDRVSIELMHASQPGTTRRIIARKVGNRLVGWHTNSVVGRDAFPWVGLMVDGERIDGIFPGGRLDLRRKLAPPSSDPTKP